MKYTPSFFLEAIYCKIRSSVEITWGDWNFFGILPFCRSNENIYSYGSNIETSYTLDRFCETLLDSTDVLSCATIKRLIHSYNVFVPEERLVVQQSLFHLFHSTNNQNKFKTLLPLY